MEWLGVWNCNFSGSEFSNFGAWNLAKIALSAEFQGFSWKIRPLKNNFRTLENGHSIRHQAIPPLSAGRLHTAESDSVLKNSTGGSFGQSWLFSRFGPLGLTKPNLPWSSFPWFFRFPCSFRCKEFPCFFEKFFPSFPRILGVQHREKSLLFWVVFLAFFFKKNKERKIRVGRN